MKQESGNDSTNLQAQHDINVNIGLTYSDAKQIALDVFKSNFYEFSEKARKIAEDRAIEITEKFIDRLYIEIQDKVSKLEEPSVQSSMFNVQKEYAKTGDKELEGRLLDLLIERINSEERSLKQIVLDEAINIIPKLTHDQINILSLLFSVVRLTNIDVRDIQQLSDFLNNRILSFYPELPPTASFFSHLQFTGCCTVLPQGNSYKPFAESMRETHKMLFSKGFSEFEFRNEVDENSGNYKSIIAKCFRDPSLFQFNAFDNEGLNNLITIYPNLIQEKIRNLFEKSTMTTSEVEQSLIDMNPRMERFMKDWEKSDLNSIELTSVGLVIAVMNYNKILGSTLVSIDLLI